MMRWGGAEGGKQDGFKLSSGIDGGVMWILKFYEFVKGMGLKRCILYRVKEK